MAHYHLPRSIGPRRTEAGCNPPFSRDEKEKWTIKGKKRVAKKKKKKRRKSKKKKGSTRERQME